MAEYYGTEDCLSTAEILKNLARRVYELENSQAEPKEDVIMTEETRTTPYRAEQRQARKGERIVIVEPNVHDSENYERGDVFTVDKVDSAGVVTTTGNIVYHEEYEVLPVAIADELADAKYRADIEKFHEMADEYERSLDGLLAQVTEENKHRAEALDASAGVYGDLAKAGYAADEIGGLAEGAMQVAAAMNGAGDEDNADADNVDKPTHYTQGGVETIDYIAQVAGGYADGFVAHCVGTCVKYVSRAPYKHESPAEDLRKARRYLDFAIERLEGER